MDNIETAIQNFTSKGFAKNESTETSLRFYKWFKKGGPAIEEYIVSGRFYLATQEYELWLNMKHGYNDAVKTFEKDLRQSINCPALDEQIDKARKEVKKKHDIPEEVLLEINCEFTLSSIIEIKGTNFEEIYAKLQTAAKKFGHEI